MSIQSFSSKRLLYDYNRLLKNRNDYIHAEPLENNIYEWHGNIAPQGGYYDGTIIHFIMRFGEYYPKEPPTISLSTGIVHSNIIPNFKGEKFYLCMDLINNFFWMDDGTDNNRPFSGWSSSYTVDIILQQLYSFLFTDEIENYDGTIKSVLYDKPPELGGGIREYNKVPNQVQEFIKDSEEFKCECCGHTYDNPIPYVKKSNSNNRDRKFRVLKYTYDINTIYYDCDYNFNEILSIKEESDSDNSNNRINDNRINDNRINDNRINDNKEYRKLYYLSTQLNLIELYSKKFYNRFNYYHNQESNSDDPIEPSADNINTPTQNLVNNTFFHNKIYKKLISKILDYDNKIIINGLSFIIKNHINNIKLSCNSKKIKNNNMNVSKFTCEYMESFQNHNKFYFINLIYKYIVTVYHTCIFNYNVTSDINNDRQYNEDNYEEKYIPYIEYFETIKDSLQKKVYNVNSQFYQNITNLFSTVKEYLNFVTDNYNIYMCSESD